MLKNTRQKQHKPQSPETTPTLVTSMPLTPSAAGMRAAETIVSLGGKAILDIVTPAEEEVLGWCCFARHRNSDEWHRVMESTGKYVFPIPDAGVEVWGFHRFDDAANDKEKVWRIYAKNEVSAGRGADVCLRLVVRSAAYEVIRELPKRVSPMRADVNMSTPRDEPRPGPVPVPATARGA